MRRFQTSFQTSMTEVLTGKKEPHGIHRVFFWLDRNALWLIPLLCWLIVWWPVVSGQAQLFARDLTFYALPLKTYMMERFWQGEFPFWTPRLSTGMPFFAELSNQVLYPLNFLYWLTPSAVQGISWQIILEHLIGFWTMAFLARTIGFSKWISLWICLIYGFSGYPLSIMDNINYHSAAAWAPLALAFFMQGIQRVYKDVDLPWGWLLGQSALTSIAMSLMLLAGDTFNPLFLGIFCTSIVLGLTGLWCWQYQKRAFVPLLQLWCHWLFSFGIVFGICAVQILPSIELVQLSVRQEMLAYSETTLWSFPWERLIELAVPYLFGSHFPEPHFIGMFMYPTFREAWADSIYIGAITLFLGSIGLIFSKSPFRWIWLWMAILAVLLAVGDNAIYYPALVKLLPILQTQRYLEKFMFFTAIALPILAGFGIHIFSHWFERLHDWLGKRKLLTRIGLTLGIFLLANLIFIQLPAQLWIWPHYYERSVDWGTHFYERGLHVVGLYWHFFVMLTAVLGLLWLNRTWSSIYLGLLLLLGIGDMIAVHYPHMPSAPSALLRDRPTPTIAKALHKLAKRQPFPNPANDTRIYYDDMIGVDEIPDESRTLKAIADANQLPYLSDPYFFRWIYRVYYNQERLLFNYGAAYGANYQNGRFAPLQPKLHKRMDMVLTKERPDLLMRLCGVQYVITPIHPSNAVWEQDYFHEVFRDAGYNVKLISIDNTLPRAYLAANTLWHADPMGIFLNVTEIVRDRPLEAWAEISPTLSVQHPQPNAQHLPAHWQPVIPSKITLLENKPESIQLRVQSHYPSDVPLVVTESWFPGWEAILDNKKPLEVSIANHRFLSVRVPSGDHTVHFRYVSTDFKKGLWVTLITLLWVALTLYWRKEKQDEEKEKEQETA